MDHLNISHPIFLSITVLPDGLLIPYLVIIFRSDFHAVVASGHPTTESTSMLLQISNSDYYSCFNSPAFNYFSPMFPWIIGLSFSLFVGILGSVFGRGFGFCFFFWVFYCPQSAQNWPPQFSSDSCWIFYFISGLLLLSLSVSCWFQRKYNPLFRPSTRLFDHHPHPDPTPQFFGSRFI